MCSMFPPRLYKAQLVLSPLLLALIFLSNASNALTQENEERSTLTLPASGTWNGYQAQINILECLNFAESDITVTLSLRSAENQELASREFSVPSQGTTHLILNELSSLSDSYGSFVIDAEADRTNAQAQLRCTSLYYRPSQDARVESFEYAFAIPLQNPISGTHQGLFNSINPSVEPTPVFNWLTVFNSSDAAFEAILELRNFDGSSRRLQRIGPLPSGQRLDIAIAHDDEFLNGQSVGLYRILPDNSEQEYHAFLSRYGSRNGIFDFAFTLLPSSGGCDRAPLFASTVGNARNWLEVANTKANEQTVEISVFDSLGNLKHSEDVILNAYAQRHIYLNSYLSEESVGSVRLRCSEPTDGGIIAQSMFYGRRDAASEGVHWAYGMQDSLPVSGPETRLVNGGNTFFGAANWLRFLSPGENAVSARVRLTSSNADRSQDQSLSLRANGSSDFAVHEFLGSDKIGASAIEGSSSAASLIAETLRVYLGSNGSVEYILNTPTFLIPRAPVQIRLEPVISGLSGPVYLTHAGDGSGRLFIIERTGKIRIVENGTLLPQPFLDITSDVGSSGEQGLHSVAFHPDYVSNGLFFIHYNNNDGDTQIVRYQRDSNNANLADPTSAKLLYELEQPNHFHNGGQIAFGKDSYLYIALGDGGFAGDPLENGQDPTNTFGTVLRIDVDQGDPYAIPNDNPFVGDMNIPSEIFAYGFRNPWRFSFDRLDGRLFLGDVGQNDVEEVDLVESGKNYGWNTMEGSRCFDPATNCDTTGLTLPIAEYTHSEGNSIIGGYVYRGEELPELQGKYLFGDFSSGKIWSLTQDQNSVWQRDQLFESESDIFVASFGEDEAGEIYVVEITGTISKIRLR